ncbi:MAG: leucine-rich repeat domain-containing protein, partial [Paenibacillus sp.]|uniref:leucine-rich repeat domain-containing protein n=1 Tax=Paenibacillus sp. TaxID=58172 RepID=UPI0025EAF7AC
NEIDIVISDEALDLFSEPVDSDIPEEIELSLVESGQSETEEIGDRLLYASFDSNETTSVSTSSVVANNSFSEDFEITDGVLVKYDGPGGDVVIPDGVTAIAPHAFSRCSNVNSISIPESVTNIMLYAFEGCDNLYEIIVSGENQYYTSNDGILYTRDMNILLQCPGAKTSVTIPSGVNKINVAAFSKCRNLTRVSIPNSLTHIGSSAFANCRNLVDITIPDSITEIGETAFYCCTAITKIRACSH